MFSYYINFDSTGLIIESKEDSLWILEYVYPQHMGVRASGTLNIHFSGKTLLMDSSNSKLAS